MVSIFMAIVVSLSSYALFRMGLGVSLPKGWIRCDFVRLHLPLRLASTLFARIAWYTPRYRAESPWRDAFEHLIMQTRKA